MQNKVEEKANIESNVIKKKHHVDDNNERKSNVKNKVDVMQENFKRPWEVFDDHLFPPEFSVQEHNHPEPQGHHFQRSRKLIDSSHSRSHARPHTPSSERQQYGHDHDTDNDSDRDRNRGNNNNNNQYRYHDNDIKHRPKNVNYHPDQISNNQKSFKSPKESLLYSISKCFEDLNEAEQLTLIKNIITKMNAQNKTSLFQKLFLDKDVEAEDRLSKMK
ncbi:hypothetical protein RFI_07719 [Reticulomyxa filosa]|uniref:Uncharacterized protein n=1 Tax=Reticulomyxa filosa TaxID=46433 RepID=X6NTV2_RETFI|nr:hypothetical protein RFI_07719 [Reticulomyxa filosa]|eukprot:ETO29396.1 hypothetical protein RFI_07719 [Reticulomyxa filosa]